MNIDHTDIAYLAIGANDALAKLKESPYDNISDGLGHSGVIAEVMEFAPLIAEAWAGVEYDDCWYYEVSEPFGRWIVDEWARTGDKPTTDAARAQLVVLYTPGITRPTLRLPPGTPLHDTVVGPATHEHRWHSYGPRELVGDYVEAVRELGDAQFYGVYVIDGAGHWEHVEDVPDSEAARKRARELAGYAD